MDVGYLTISDIGYDTVSFRTVQQTRIGQMMFKGDIYVHKDSCTDQEGCICGNRDIR
jgi:hypothetical protein